MLHQDYILGHTTVHDVKDVHSISDKFNFIAYADDTTFIPQY